MHILKISLADSNRQLRLRTTDVVMHPLFIYEKIETQGN